MRYREGGTSDNHTLAVELRTPSAPDLELDSAGVTDLIVLILATYRLTRLFTADKITEVLRGRVEALGRWPGYLITCDWCLSIWIAPWVAYASEHWMDSTIGRVAILALALSGATGLLSLGEARLDR